MGLISNLISNLPDTFKLQSVGMISNFREGDLWENKTKNLITYMHTMYV
jgi:hypothetical protein